MINVNSHGSVATLRCGAVEILKLLNGYKLTAESTSEQISKSINIYKVFGKYTIDEPHSRFTFNNPLQNKNSKRYIGAYDN